MILNDRGFIFVKKRFPKIVTWGEVEGRVSHGVRKCLRDPGGTTLIDLPNIPESFHLANTKLSSN